MERIELALRRYKQLVPDAVSHAQLPLHDLEIWLREEVCPALDDFSCRTEFRKYASWSLRVLRPGSNSRERALVTCIDSDIVECSKVLLNVAKYKEVQRQLHELFPPRAQTLREEVLIDGSGQPKTLSRETTESCPIETLHSQVKSTAEHFDWSDLVNVNDYFEPQQQWSTLDDGTRLQHGEWIVSLNPDLLPIGDFIVRCLYKRIALRFDAISEFRRMCLYALARAGKKYQRHRDTVDVVWKRLSDAHNDLDFRLRSGRDARLRDACVAATQLYSAIHPRPDLGWLGLQDSVIEHGSNMLRLRLRSLQNAYVFDRIAAALRELQLLYPADDSGRRAIEEAIASGELVVDETKCEVYWERACIEIRPGSPQWKLMLALCRKGQRGLAAGVADVYGDEIISDTAMATVWSRLKNVLPASLSRNVYPGNEPRTYRLKLEPHRTHIFSADS